MLPIDAALGLAMALLAAYLFSHVPALAGDGVGQKSARFETHANMLLVRVTLYRTAAPTIDAVEPLAEGRVTLTAAGPNGLELLDAGGNVVFSQSFAAYFVQGGEPPRVVDRVQMLFVAPYGEKIKRVRVTTPANGAAEAAVEGR